MISLTNEIPLPFDDEIVIHQNYKNSIKKLNSWKEKLGQNIIEKIINKALNNKIVVSSLFYTDKQLIDLNNETKKEIEQIIHVYKEFKQLLILTGLLKTFSDFELQKTKQYLNELSPELLNKLPIFVIWFVEEIRKKIIDSSELLNLLDDLA